MNDIAKGINHTSQLPGSATSGPDGGEVVTTITRGTHADNESAERVLDAHEQEGVRLANAGALAPWLAEKFHWIQRKDGSPALQPHAEYLNAVITDAPKFIVYGEKLMQPDSVEWLASNDLAGHFAALVSTFAAFDESDRELNALKRYVTERSASNFVYAAITQFEIDSWANRAANGGKNAADHENFGEKLSRRDEFALNGYVMLCAGRQGFGVLPMTPEQLERQAKSLIFQQARMRTSEQLKPQAQSEQNQQARAAAVMASRPI